MQSVNKIHSTRISLNDRFTIIQTVQPNATSPRRRRSQSNNSRVRSSPKSSLQNRRLLEQLDQKHMMRTALRLKKVIFRSKITNKQNEQANRNYEQLYSWRSNKIIASRICEYLTETCKKNEARKIEQCWSCKLLSRCGKCFIRPDKGTLILTLDGWRNIILSVARATTKCSLWQRMNQNTKNSNISRHLMNFAWTQLAQLS